MEENRWKSQGIGSLGARRPGFPSKLVDLFCHVVCGFIFYFKDDPVPQICAPKTTLEENYTEMNSWGSIIYDEHVHRIITSGLQSLCGVDHGQENS